MAGDIDQWLDDLGLSKYIRVFAENEIDLAALPHFNEADLKDLGLPAGPRKKILAAISDLQSAEQPQVNAEQSRREVERRQLTVMFCDLVGSTALSQRLDPEDSRTVIQSFQETCAVAVREHGGYVAKHLGDGLLAYFGYPQAQEDDAVRAVRAGLAMARAVAGLEASEPLQARVGIETGLVVIGDMLGESMSQRGEISGETPNLAARLQQIAAPGSVVVGPTTRRVLGGVFTLEDLGPQALKGVGKPVSVSKVLGEVRAQSRFDAHQAGGLTAFVGREAELDMLLHRWQEAKDGEGQVVLVSGEPGIGKSRLTQELRNRIATEPHTWLRYQCSPHHTSSALHPVISQLTFAAHLDPDEPAATKLDKLERLISRGTRDVSSVAPLFADLLSVPSNGRYPPLAFSPSRQREETAAALVDQLTGLCANRPVLMVWEDVHWIDPTTEELLDLVVRRTSDLPLLVVVTFRPEYHAPWTGAAHVTSLMLSRLGRRFSERIMVNVALSDALPDGVVEDIMAEAEGVPLFIEELTKAVLEAGPCAPGSAGTMRVPASLKDSLTARLDRLGPAREVAHTAACIGRQFEFRLLHAVSSLSATELEQALGRLMAAGLAFGRGVAPDATYTFKHALVRDAAYESLLNSKRRQLHGLIAQALEREFPDRIRAEPEVMAHHLTEGGIAERAIGYWLQAGEHAIRRSANIEAISHLRRGLELVETLPDTTERARIELGLQVPLGAALTASKGWSASETVSTYSRARELCHQVGKSKQVAPVLYGLWGCLLVRGEHEEALHLSEESLSLANRESDSTLQLLAHDMLGMTNWFVGKLDVGLAHLTEAVSRHDPKQHRNLVYLGGEDPLTESLSWQALAYWFLGYPEKAMGPSDDACAWAAELSYGQTSAYALFFRAFIHWLRREWLKSLQYAEDTIAVSTERGIKSFLSAGTALRGAALTHITDPGDGIAEIRKGIDGWEAIEARAMLPSFLLMAAEGAALAGRLGEGLKAVEEGIDLIARTGERVWEPELHRQRGELLMGQSGHPSPEAELCFRRAIEVAQNQNAKSPELRATTSLARLWLGQGRAEEAREVLALLYEWFTEGFDTADLKEAKALLDELN